MSESKTLGDALPDEIKRVTNLIPIYVECGPAAAFAVAMMKVSLDRAIRALAEGDVIEMMESLADLRGHSD